jgi:hypothetical protein
MTMTQAVVSYAIVFVVLLFGLGLSLWQHGISWPKFPRLALAKRGAMFDGWRKTFDNEKQNFVNGEFWLKVLLAAFIALCGGVSLVAFLLPYGSGWVVIGLLTALFLLATLIPYLLA